MSCGLEHLSNCHGEWTIIAMGAGAGAFWFRRVWARVVGWFRPKPAPDKHCCDDETKEHHH